MSTAGQNILRKMKHDVETQGRKRRLAAPRYGPSAYSTWCRECDAEISQGADCWFVTGGDRVHLDCWAKGMKGHENAHWHGLDATWAGTCIVCKGAISKDEPFLWRSNTYGTCCMCPPKEKK